MGSDAIAPGPSTGPGAGSPSFEPSAEALGWFSLAACSILLRVNEGLLAKRFERARNEHLPKWCEIVDRRQRQPQYLLRLDFARQLVSASI